MSQQKYEYYGFISYNRHDRKWAQMLQKQLERYPLPASLRKERPDIPKHITPIFLDQSDLVSHDEGLEQALLDKLDASAYLIVLCSPNSAHSSWVDAEIRHFIETGRLKRIIPVVISGESHAADPEKECYPPALRDLTGSDKLLSIRVENHGKNGVILRLAATILGLRMDDLITRDAAYRKRRRLAFTFAAMIMAAVIAAAVWYNTPHSAYYRDVIFRWEIPTGIGRVSAEERKSQYYTYRLTTLQNRVIRMERVNSVGIPVTGYSFMNYGSTPVVQYIYENNGKLSRAEYYDAYERPLYEVSYSPDLRILDFVHFDSGYSYSLTSGTDSLQFRPEKSAIENHNDVIRYVQDYDGDGLLIRRMFKRDNRGSSGGTPVRNSSGVWGEAYSYDISGRPVSSCGIDQDGMIMAGVDGIACQKYSYDEKGRQESQTLTDKDGNTTAKNGTASVRFSYDENNRIDRTNYYNTEGDLFSRTASSVSFEYDAHGFLTGIGYFDSQNAPLYVD